MFKDKFRVERIGHTAWTPPSLPDTIVLLGGIGSTYYGSAEIVPGIKASNPSNPSFQVAQHLTWHTLQRVPVGYPMKKPLS